MKFLKKLFLFVLIFLGICSAVEAKYAFEKEVAYFRQFIGTEVTVGYTGSMKPYIYGGDKIRITYKPFEQLKIGDLVIYFNPFVGKWIPHRIVGGDLKRGFIVAGDNIAVAFSQGGSFTYRPRDWVRVTRDNYIGTWIKVQER